MGGSDTPVQREQRAWGLESVQAQLPERARVLGPAQEQAPVQELVLAQERALALVPELERAQEQVLEQEEVVGVALELPQQPPRPATWSPSDCCISI